MSRARFIASLTGFSPAIPEVIRSVCIGHGVSRSQLFGMAKANTKISRARQEAYVRLHKITRSLSEVGRIMGKDHTTVLHGIRAYQSRSERKEIA